MSKKPGAAFTLPAKGVDAWVAGVAGTPAEMGTPAPAEAAVKLARLTIDLPADLHRQFKVAAARNGVGMVDVVREAIELWIQKHG